LAAGWHHRVVVPGRPQLDAAHRGRGYRAPTRTEIGYKGATPLRTTTGGGNACSAYRPRDLRGDARVFGSGRSHLLVLTFSRIIATAKLPYRDNPEVYFTVRAGALWSGGVDLTTTGDGFYYQYSGTVELKIGMADTILYTGDGFFTGSDQVYSEGGSRRAITNIPTVSAFTDPQTGSRRSADWNLCRGLPFPIAHSRSDTRDKSPQSSQSPATPSISL
jgi:hypothetical protein